METTGWNPDRLLGNEGQALAWGRRFGLTIFFHEGRKDGKGATPQTMHFRCRSRGQSHGSTPCACDLSVRLRLLLLDPQENNEELILNDPSRSCLKHDSAWAAPKEKAKGGQQRRQTAYQPLGQQAGGKALDRVRNEAYLVGSKTVKKESMSAKGFHPLS